MASYWSPRRLLDDASDVLDTVLHPLANHTDEEAREDAFHDKIIKVRRCVPPPPASPPLTN